MPGRGSQASAFIWLVALMWCPVAAFFGGVIVAVLMQDIVVGATAGFAGLLAGFVVVATITSVVDARWLQKPGRSVLRERPLVGRGLMVRRKVDPVRDGIEVVLVAVLVLAAFFGGPVAVLCVTIIAGSYLAG